MGKGQLENNGKSGTGDNDTASKGNERVQGPDNIPLLWQSLINPCTYFMWVITM